MNFDQINLGAHAVIQCKSCDVLTSQVGRIQWQIRKVIYEHKQYKIPNNANKLFDNGD